jgi:hypothetical protein
MSDDLQHVRVAFAHIITSRNPADLGAFYREMTTVFAREPSFQ